MIKCIWLRYRQGNWVCTYPEPDKKAGIPCGPSNNPEAEKLGRNYCKHYSPQEILL